MSNVYHILFLSQPLLKWPEPGKKAAKVPTFMVCARSRAVNILIVSTEIAPLAAAIDREDHFPSELWMKMGD
ncbi:hypothetical protein [Desulfocastanea catecholica]